MVGRRSLSLLILTFFGLTSDIVAEARVALFRQIHQIIFHGKGGYDHPTVYNMPIWLRKFTFHEIKTFYDEEKAEYEKSTSGNKTTLIDSSGNINVPEFMKASKDTNPTYTTKASKK